MKVLILGLGQYPKGSGIMVSLYFAKRGDRVMVADPYYTPAMAVNVARLKKFKNVSFLLGARATQKVAWADLVIRHQRFRDTEPELVKARKLGKHIETELSLFLRACPARVIGVTGTRGKSTTTALIHKILKAHGRCRVWLGGNILISPLDFLSKIKPQDLVVLEMSSFQLEGTGSAGVSPHIAVWTNLLRDHLNAYPNMEAYAEAKAQIFRHQKPDDVVFLPADSFFTPYAKSAPGTVYRFGKEGSPEKKMVSSTPLKLLGEHNKINAEMAVAVALYLGVSIPTIRRVLRSFSGLPDRLKTIAIRRGICFVNDTTATTPDATMVAIKAVKELKTTSSPRIHLIFGGADKELAFDEVARFLHAQKQVHVYLLPGTARKKILVSFKKRHVDYQPVENLSQAVDLARRFSVKGDIVLLSPGCASFGQFKNEYDRGNQFRALVKKVKSYNH